MYSLLHQFMTKEKDTVIAIRTQQEWYDLMELLETKTDFIWSNYPNDKKPTKVNHWSNYKEKTAIIVYHWHLEYKGKNEKMPSYLMYADCEYYTNKGYTIIEAHDVLEQELPNKELDRLVYQEISQRKAKYRDMLETINYAIWLLEENNQGGNEITNNLRNTKEHLEYDLWKEVLEDEDRYNDFENDND